MGSVGAQRIGGGSTAAATMPVANVVTGQVINENLLSAEDIRREERNIDKKGFTAQGNGVWEFTGPYTIGAQILDETDSSAGGYGRFKQYSVQTWGQHVEDISPRRYYDTLNAAKTAAKEEMKEWLKSVTRR